MWLTVKKAKPLAGYKISIRLTDDTVVTRDVSELLRGPLFEPLRDRKLFKTVKADSCGGIVWTNGADISPDIIIWGKESPPERSSLKPPAYLNHYPGCRRPHRA